MTLTSAMIISKSKALMQIKMMSSTSILAETVNKQKVKMKNRKLKEVALVTFSILTSTPATTINPKKMIIIKMLNRIMEMILWTF
jgi:hypothetical protein